jgi:hypothetical protein
MKNATATSHGRSRMAAADGVDAGAGAINGPEGFISASGGLTATLMLADVPGTGSIAANRPFL